MCNRWSLFASHSGVWKGKLSQWISATSQIVQITITDNSEVAPDISTRYVYNFKKSSRLSTANCLIDSVNHHFHVSLFKSILFWIKYKFCRNKSNLRHWFEAAFVKKCSNTFRDFRPSRSVSAFKSTLFLLTGHYNAFSPTLCIYSRRIHIKVNRQAHFVFITSIYSNLMISADSSVSQLGISSQWITKSADTVRMHLINLAPPSFVKRN